MRRTVDPDDLPEPPIPNRAGRAARLAAMPYRCTHTGCHGDTHRYPCPIAAEIHEAEYEARGVGA